MKEAGPEDTPNTCSKANALEESPKPKENEKRTKRLVFDGVELPPMNLPRSVNKQLTRRTDEAVFKEPQEGSSHRRVQFEERESEEELLEEPRPPTLPVAKSTKRPFDNVPSRRMDPIPRVQERPS